MTAVATSSPTGFGRLSGPEDTTALFEVFRTSADPGVRERLILEHRHLAEQCARRFRNRGEADADLEQVAYLGLIKAIDRFDPAMGVPFHGYAVPTIVGEIKRHFRDTTWAVSVPRGSKDLLSRLSATTDRLHQEFGRTPTVRELSLGLGVDDTAVEQALQARSANRVGVIDESGNRSSVRNAGDSTDAVDARVVATAAIAGLDDRMRSILIWRYWEECTQREIAERLGIGQVQVSRLLRSALAAMRARATSCDGTDLGLSRTAPGSGPARNRGPLPTVLPACGS